jgi:hypothetical protein
MVYINIRSYYNGFITIVIVLRKYSWKPQFEDKNVSKNWATSFSDRTDAWECQICVAAIRLEMTKKVKQLSTW